MSLRTALRTAIASLLIALAVPAGAMASGFALSGKLVQGGLVTGLAPVSTVQLWLDDTPVALAPDGGFVVGFGRDHPGSAVLTAQLADGERVTETLKIAARAFPVQRVDGLPPQTVTIPPELQARRAQEVAQIVAARAERSGQEHWRTGFVWPAQGRISGIYGSQRIRNGVPGSPHFGVDVANKTGTPVKAPAAGIVRLAAPSFLLEGGLILIDHGFGVVSDFLHLSRIDVKPGDLVSQGQVIGAIGATGRATGPHLHWGMRWNDVRLDPQLLAGAFSGPGLAPATIAAAQPIATGGE
jgi:murein DD-endopeptidase MepM/ murein hydrolase activator NlpD